MRYGKNILITTVLMILFLFFYIRQVNQERVSGIQLLFTQPQTGDVYKIRYTNSEGNKTVRYFKIARIKDGAVFFYRGKLSAWNVSDVFLDDFDRDRIESFSGKELRQIKDGTFSNNEMSNALLVEIERKNNRIPDNSI
ncbi:hypothetical protein [Agriterribacter sp.]|uniref:hypothetical protein n=1 Tax=Agriterribacter sp. TaxID=2821509 RepID=UPI002B98EDFA|nr:hypothetical protein [Agriterribacter sp.]HTN08161.1 hypothetical protein [Agriterribacter sp.]